MCYKHVVIAVANCGLILACCLWLTGCNPSVGGSTEDVDDSSDSDGIPAAETSALQAVPVQAEELSKEDVNTIKLPGSVHGFESAELYGKMGGYVESIGVDIGDAVQKGDVLARLDIPEMAKQVDQKKALVDQARAQIQQASAATVQAQAETGAAVAALAQTEATRQEKHADVNFCDIQFQRYQNLSESTSIDRRKVDEVRYQLEAARASLQSLNADIQAATAAVNAAKAKVQKAKADEMTAQAQFVVARADLDRAESLVQYTAIKAPFDGLITKRMVDTGDFIQSAENNSAAMPLLVIARVDKVRIVFHVPMSDVELLDLGDRAVLDEIPALPGRRFEGTIIRMAMALDEKTRTMRTEIHLTNSPKAMGVNRLLPGYYGYVTLYLDE